MSWRVPTYQTLSGFTVIDLTTEIAGPYSTMLLGDLGARVIRLETPGSDGVRRQGPSRPGQDSSALWEYLNGSKELRDLDPGRPLPEVLAEVLVDADALVEDLGAGGLEAAGVSPDRLRREDPRLTVVRISDSGQTGPLSGVPMTPLVRQAASGWLSGRGLPEREPVQVGGRIPEYVGGAFAALAVLTGIRQAQRCGEGPVVDLSLVEAELASLSYPMLSHEMAVKRGMAQRPSTLGAMLGVVRCRDGWIGINSLTGQHWLDICSLMEVPEFAEHQLAIMFGGPERAQFFAAVQPWLDQRDAGDVLELCQAMRIPAAPVGNGATMPGLAQYAARDFFVTAEDGTVAPGSPFRLSHRAAAPISRPQPDPTADPAAPFADLRVLDLSSFWAGAYTACYLGAFGADVIKVESVQRPDGFRFTGVFPFDGDEWYELGGMWQGANLNKRDLTLDLGRDAGRALLRRLVASADVVIENYSPRVMEQFGLTEDVLLELAQDLIVLRMPGFGLEGPWKNFVGWAYGIEQTSGMAWVTGYEDGAPINPGGPADPIIGVHAGIALLAALEHRRRTGEGQLVEVAQIEVAAALTAEQVLTYSLTGECPTRHGNRQHGLVQGVYPAEPEEELAVWVAISLRSDDEWRALRGVLETAGVDTAGAPQNADESRHDEIDALIGSWTAGQPAGEIVAALRAVGVPAAVAIVPSQMYDQPQLEARRFYCELDHPVSGTRRYPGWPMRFDPGPDEHHRLPCPTLGQHNDEILAGELALTGAQLEELRSEQVIGERPLGV